jgi:hypothetical protein
MSIYNQTSQPDGRQLSLDYGQQGNNSLPSAKPAARRSLGKPPRQSPGKRKVQPVAPGNRLEPALPFDFLGTPPVIWEEDPGPYREHRAHLSEALKPSDYIEVIWVDEAAALIWDKLQYRRLKRKIQNQAAADELECLLSRFIGDGTPAFLGASTPARKLARKFIKGEARAVEKVRRLLTAARMSWEDVVAQAMPRWIDEATVLDEKIERKLALFNALLRQIDEHRATFGQRVRHAARQIDAEFHHIDMSKGVQKHDQSGEVEG